MKRNKMKTWKTLIVLSSILFLTVMLVPDVHSAQTTPQKGGVFKTATSSPAPTYSSMLRPSITIFPYTTPVFNGLVMVDPSQEEVSPEKVVPSLAEKWEVSPDGKIYTFYLRKGVKFHDGHPFTAEDVKYSLEFFANPKMSANAQTVTMMDKVEIIDDYTVKVTLKYPHKPFLLYLCNPYCVMLPAHIAPHTSVKSTDFLIGTGPFKFKNNVPGKVWIYERNPDYFMKGLPYLDGVEVYVMNWGIGVDAYCGKRLSMANNPRYGIQTAVSLRKIKQHRPDSTIKFKPVAGVQRGIYFNLHGLKGHEGPWQDVRVRQAMAMIIEYDNLVTAAQGSRKLGLCSGPVPPGTPTAFSWKEVLELYGADKPMDERVKEAKKLMKEAGYADGFEGEMITRARAVYTKPSAFITENWRKYLNINIEIRPLETPVLFPRLEDTDFDLAFEGTPPMYGGAPEETLGFWVRESTMNRGRWNNQEYDRLYTDLVKESDPKKRDEISKKMQKIWLKEVPYLIGFMPVVGVAVPPEVHGHVMHPGHTGWSALDRIWLEK